MFAFIKKAHQSLTASEKRFLALIILVLLCLSSLATIYAQLIVDSDYYFTGINIMAGADKSVYFSQIEQAREGQILFKNLYTSEPQQAKFLAPIWLILGWLAKFTGFSNLLIFHLARILTGAFFLYFLYLFISRLFKSVLYRKLAFLILGFSSGFGIFTLKRFISEEIIYNYYGTDMWVSEGNTFLTLTHSPLFILSQIFMLLIFWWLIERLRASHYLEVGVISLITLFLGIFHPYDLVTIYSVLAVWLAVEFIRQKKISWSLIFKSAIIFAISFLAIIYFLWLFQSEPAIANWAVQNLTVSPRFLNYLVGYGLLFGGALIALFKLAKSPNNYLRFLAIWTIVGWLMLFVPLQFQRRLSNGLHIPMAIAGFGGLIMLINWLKKNWSSLSKRKIFQLSALVIIILLLVLTTFYNIFQEVVIYSYLNAPQFITTSAYEAMKWLKVNTPSNSVILAEPVDGNIIPGVSGNVVYIGHGHQTTDWSTKLNRVKNWFFASNTHDQAKKEWLDDEGIDYIFFSKREDNLGRFNPQEKDYLEKVYNNEGVSIYKVR